MIYFILDRAASSVKIGYSSDVWSRFYQIQTANPAQLELAAVQEGSKASEKELHKRFASERIRGEWFRFSAEIAQHVETLPPALKDTPYKKTAEFWGMPAAEVARRTGISKSHICRIQNGIDRPSADRALILQRATGVSAIKLVFGERASEAT